MSVGLRAWLKRIPLARTVWETIRPRSHAEQIDERDRRLTNQILARVLREDSNCVDIGAHAGDFLAELVRRAPRGRHLAIEPIAEMANKLGPRFPTVDVRNLAIGDRSGEVTFQWVESNPAFSGLLRRPDLSPGERVREVKVACEPLDALIPAGQSITLLKVDVEGAEMGVFRGARRILRECRPWIHFEHGAISEQTYGASSTQVFEELASHGLSIWTLESWVAGRNPLTVPEFLKAIESRNHWNFLAGPSTGGN